MDGTFTVNKWIMIIGFLITVVSLTINVTAKLEFTPIKNDITQVKIKDTKQDILMNKHDKQIDLNKQKLEQIYKLFEKIDDKLEALRE